MNLLLKFLQALLLFRISGSLADEDVFLSSDDGLSSIFLPLESTDEETLLSLGLGSAAPISEDLTSAIFSPGDLSTFLTSNENDPGADLFGTESIAISPFDEFTSSNEGFDLDQEFSSELLASSGASCVSDAEGQFIGRIRRREDGRCSNPTILQKEPATDGQESPKNPNGVFPPPGSNPGRITGPWNDPKPRPEWEFPTANSDFDFEYCPSGVNGYRKYAICDSGIEKDRYGRSPFKALYHCTRRRFIFLIKLSLLSNSPFD